MRSSTVQATCPICDESVNVKPVTRVVVDDDVDLASDLAHGRVNSVTCRVCGHAGILGEPLLVVSPSVVAGYMPVSVPANRKAGIAQRLEKRAKVAAEDGQRVAVCFGPRQLRREFPDLPWPRRLPLHWHRFEDPGTPEHRRRMYERLRESRPDDPMLHLRLGITYQELRRYRDARRMLHVTLRADPTNADALFALASVELDDRHPGEAVRLYDKVVSVTHDVLPRYLAGVAAFRDGQHRAAIERLQIVIREQADHIDAYIWLARAKLALGDRAGAIAALRSAAENGLKNPDIITRQRDFEVLISDGAFKPVLAAVRKQHEMAKRRTERSDRRAGYRGDHGRPRETRPRRRR